MRYAGNQQIPSLVIENSQISTHAVVIYCVDLVKRLDSIVHNIILSKLNENRDRDPVRFSDDRKLNMVLATIQHITSNEINTDTNKCRELLNQELVNNINDVSRLPWKLREKNSIKKLNELAKLRDYNLSSQIRVMLADYDAEWNLPTHLTPKSKLSCLC